MYLIALFGLGLNNMLYIVVISAVENMDAADTVFKPPQPKKLKLTSEQHVYVKFAIKTSLMKQEEENTTRLMSQIQSHWTLYFVPVNKDKMKKG